LSFAKEYDKAKKVARTAKNMQARFFEFAGVSLAMQPGFLKFFSTAIIALMCKTITKYKKKYNALSEICKATTGETF